MHELSVASDMIRIISDVLEGPRRLERVNVTIGPLSGISPDSLSFCFATVARESGFGEPELHIEEIAARLVCLDCGTEYNARDFYDGCPDCGSIMRRILTGSEFTIDSVELEDGED